MKLTFDCATHTYRDNGAVIPGVTSLLAPLIDYSMVREEVLAMAAERGSAVHYATQLYDENNLDEDSIDIRILGYLNAWKRFRDDQQFEPYWIEKPLGHPVHRFGGTPDRFGRMKGERTALDIKTVSKLMPATAVQTAAYQELGRINDMPTECRVAVQLKADGTYRMETYRSRDDWPTFLSLLTVHNWKTRHG